MYTDSLGSKKHFIPDERPKAIPYFFLSFENWVAKFDLV